MRVDAEELAAIRDRVAQDGRRYNGLDLDGAVIDVDYALTDAGFTPPEIDRTGEPERMVVYTSRPTWPEPDRDDVVRRLEETWRLIGAFRHEAHTIAREATGVALDFVTWWDSGAYYTGQIAVALEPDLS